MHKYGFLEKNFFLYFKKYFVIIYFNLIKIVCIKAII